MVMANSLGLFGQAQLLPMLSRLGCESVKDVPYAAEQFFLEEDIPYETGAREVDRRIKRALQKNSIQIERIRRQDSKYIARLYLAYDRFIIRVRGDLKKRTFRFAVAHELAHTLAYYRENGRIHRQKPNGRFEEFLCTEIARQLLLPDLLLKNVLPRIFCNNTCDGELLDQIASSYEVAPWQVLVRCLKAQERKDLIAILWSSSPTPLLDDPDGKKYIKVIGSWGMPGIYIPKNDRVFMGSEMNRTIWRLSQPDMFNVTGRARFNLGSLQGEMNTICLRPLSRPEHLVQIVFLDEDHILKARRWQKRRGIRD